MQVRLKRSISNENSVSLFTGRKTAFRISGPGQFAEINKTDIKYDVTPIPGFEDGEVGPHPQLPAGSAVSHPARQGYTLAAPWRRIGRPSQSAAGPALGGYAGREVAIGLRSEDMEEARLARGRSDNPRIRATVADVEALGSAIMVHFGVDTANVETEAIRT